VVTPQTIIETAIESDCLYFELAAKKENLTGAQLAWMPGLESLSSASVIQRINQSSMPELCVSEAQHFCVRHHINVMRLYLAAIDPRWDNVLTRDGFTSRGEFIMIADAKKIQSWSNLEPLELKLIQSESQWHERYLMLAKGGHAPDGYSTEAARYIDMEKKKSHTGPLSFYLAYDLDGAAVGSVGLMAVGSICRLKNLVVHPDVRGRGIASRLIAQVGSYFVGADQHLVAFAVDHAVRGSLYDRLGFNKAATYFEWRKKTGS